MISLFIYILLSLSLTTKTPSTLPEEVKSYMVSKINEVRSNGCKCGSKYMGPVQPVSWNETLYKSAMSHAKDMAKNGFFDHFSSTGQDIGQRLDQFDYYWQFAGENLGEGQNTFEEVMRDWIASPSHCEMLMNPNMKEVAVAKFNKFWVQHFGTKIPPGAKRI